MRQILYSILVCACSLLCEGARASNANYDDMIEVVSGLYEELLQQGIASEVPGFMTQHDTWIETNVELCGVDPQVGDCLNNIQRRIQYLSQLKVLMAGLVRINEHWKALQIESSPKLPVRVQKHVKSWTRSIKNTCVRKMLSDCEDALRQLDDRLLADLIERRYLVEHKKHLHFYERHFLQVLATVKSVTPTGELHRRVLEISKRKKKEAHACMSASGSIQTSPITGNPLNGSDIYRCQWQRLNALTIDFELAASKRRDLSLKLPKGDFSWIDGVGVWVADPIEPISQQGTVSVNPTEDGVNIDLHYVGINGHTCTFDATFLPDLKVKNVYRYAFDSVYENEKCELNAKFSQNFLHFTGVDAQSACSAALGCGFRAYLPDAVPLGYFQQTRNNLFVNGDKR